MVKENKKANSFKNKNYVIANKKWTQLWKNNLEIPSSEGRRILLMVYPPFLKDLNKVIKLKRSFEPNDIDRVEKHWLVKINLDTKTFTAEGEAQAINILYGAHNFPDSSSYLSFSNSNLVNVQINLDQPESLIINELKKLRVSRKNYINEISQSFKKIAQERIIIPSLDPVAKKLVLDQSDLLIFNYSIEGLSYGKIAKTKAKIFNYSEVHPTSVEKRFKESLLPFVDPFKIGSEQYLVRKPK